MRNLGFALLFAISTALFAEEILSYEASAKKSFSDVMVDLEHAIKGKNFRITGKNEIGYALRERGQADFPDATVVSFCNLEFARRILQKAPDRLVDMPCRVSVWQQGDQVRLMARLLPEDDERIAKEALEVNAILKFVIDEAVLP